MIYLDNAATTLAKPPQVAKEMLHALECMGNAGRGGHDVTLTTSRIVYHTRERLAAMFHAEDPSRIAFSCNATESLNTAICGILEPGDHVISTVCEHNSVLRPLYRMQERDVELTLILADKKGVMDYDGFEAALQPNTKAMVITHASNLTGNITDLAFISDFAHKHGLLLIVDASQTAGCVPIDVQKMGIDILCFTGHKGLMGPQGTGGIYVRPDVTVRSLKVGGSGILSYSKTHPADMPTALEAGTLNGHGIAGLYGALSFLEEIGIEKITEREEILSREFHDGVSRVEGVKVYGDFTHPRTGIVSLNIGDLDSGVVSDYLWEDYEIAVRAGAHCAPLMHEALGTKEQGAVRFSFSYFNTKEEVQTAIHAVREIAGSR